MSRTLGLLIECYEDHRWKNVKLDLIDPVLAEYFHALTYIHYKPIFPVFTPISPTFLTALINASIAEDFDDLNLSSVFPPLLCHFGLPHNASTETKEVIESCHDVGYGPMGYFFITDLQSFDCKRSMSSRC